MACFQQDGVPVKDRHASWPIFGRIWCPLGGQVGPMLAQFSGPVGCFCGPRFRHGFRSRFGCDLGPNLGPNRHPKRPRKATQTSSKAKRAKVLKFAPLLSKMLTFAHPRAHETAPKGLQNIFENVPETATPKRGPTSSPNGPTWAPKSAPKPLLNGSENPCNFHRRPKTPRPPQNSRPGGLHAPGRFAPPGLASALWRPGAPRGGEKGEGLKGNKQHKGS